MVFVLVRGLQRVVGGVVSGLCLGEEVAEGSRWGQLSPTRLCLGEEVAEGSRRCGEWSLSW